MLRTHRTAATLALLLTVASLSGTSVPAQADSHRLRMTGQGAPGSEVTGPEQVSVVGGTRVDLDVSAVSGGEATVVKGPGDGLRRAIRFPAYVGSGSYPQAALEVRPTSGDAFDPGGSDFAFGAVLRLNAVSSGRGEDDGDNVFQRGLYGDGAQFKLQLDAARPSCSVRGASGRVTAQAAEKIRRKAWYSVRCVRRGDSVTVRVKRYTARGWGHTRTARGATGILDFAADVPASVGGKLNRSGTVVSGSSDQFNGRVAKVWIKRV